MKKIYYGMMNGALCAEFLGVDVPAGGADGAGGESAPTSDNGESDVSADKTNNEDAVGDNGADVVSPPDVEPVSWEQVAEEYIPPPPEGMSAEEWGSTIDVIAKAAHEAGVDKDVFAKLVEVHLERDAQIAEAQESAVKDGIEQLKSEWGAEYPIKVQAAVSTLEKYAQRVGINFESIASNPAFSMNVPLMRILAAVANDVGGGKGVSVPGAATGGGGNAEADRIMSDPSHPMHEAFMNPNHIGYKSANARVNSLLGIN